MTHIITAEILRATLAKYEATPENPNLIRFLGEAMLHISKNHEKPATLGAGAFASDGWTIINGFSSDDVHDGSISAKYYRKQKHFLRWQVEKWIKPTNDKGYTDNGRFKNAEYKNPPRLMKYWAQIDELAQKKI